MWDVEGEGLAKQGYAHPLVETMIDLLLVMRLITPIHCAYSWVEDMSTILQLKKYLLDREGQQPWYLTCLYGRVKVAWVQQKALKIPPDTPCI